MAIDTATFEATLDSKIDAATTSNDAKEFLLLAKAVEATNNAISSSALSVSNNLSDVANSTTALTNLGAAGLASPAFTGTPTAPTATAGTNTTQLATTAFVAGEVAGIVDSAPATLDTLNELAAALGDDANFSTTVTNSIATKMPLSGGTFTGNVTIGDHTQLLQDDDLKFIAPSSTVGIQDARIAWWNETEAGIMAMIAVDRTASTFAPADLVFYTTTSVDSTANNGEGDRAERLRVTTTGADVTGTLTADGVTVDGTLDIEEVYEKATIDTSQSGTIAFDTTSQGILFLFSNQTANRTINFTNVNANLAIGQSVTTTVLCSQGTTAYYLSAYQVDGTAVTPKWSGGSAPTAGNASGIDVYTFTIIKTADATFTVLASQTQYA